MQRKKAEIIQHQNEIIKNINQFLGSFTEIKTKSKESFFQNKYSDVLNKYETNLLFIKILKILPKIFLEIIAASGILLIVFFRLKVIAYQILFHI